MNDESRFGAHHSVEEKEADREKVLEKEKLAPDIIQRRNNLKKTLLSYDKFLEHEDDSYIKKLSPEEVNQKFTELLNRKSFDELDEFLADFIIDFCVNKERKKNQPPKWEPPSMGYLENLIRKASI